MKTPHPAENLEALRRLSTCVIANAIDTFEVRLRNEGFTGPGIRCFFPRLAPMLGYAATVKIRCSSPPPSHPYVDRTDWWKYILARPEPRVVVIQDVDNHPGTGALIGDIHATILQALGCVGVVTNGAVRDLPIVETMSFPLFAGNAAVSHAYSHIVEFGTEVEIGGLKIKPGDLLHGDSHGILSIPQKLVSKIPAVAARLEEQDKKLIALCRSHDFTLDRLNAAVKEKP